MQGKVSCTLGMTTDRRSMKKKHPGICSLEGGSRGKTVHDGRGFVRFKGSFATAWVGCVFFLGKEKSQGVKGRMELIRRRWKREKRNEE